MQAVRLDSALHFLAEASNALSESLDYEKTLETVAHVLVPRYAARCAIDLLADDGKLHRVAQVGIDPPGEGVSQDAAGQYLIASDLEGSLPMARVLRTRKPFLLSRVTDAWLNEVTTNSDQRAMCEALRGRSCMAVPLIARGRLIGVVSLASEAEDVWGADDLVFAQEIANRCAIAIDNARLYREARLNEHRLTFLADFSLSISSALHVEESIVKAAAQVVPDFAEQCLILVVEPDGSFRRIASVYEDESKLPVARELTRSYPPHRNPKSMVLETSRTRAPVLFSALTDDDMRAIAQDERHLELIKQINCQSGIVVPVQARGKLLGTLVLGSEHRNRFSSSDLEFAVDLARRCAVALENARLLEESENARRRLAILSDASVVLASRIELEPALGNMVGLLVPALTGCAAIFLMKGERLHLVRITCSDAAAQPLAEDLYSKYAPELNIGIDTLNSLDAGSAELVREFTEDYLVNAGEDRARLYRALGWKSAIVAPLVSHRQVTGVLALMRDSSQPLFGSDEVALAQELARRAAIAVENAALYERAEHGRFEAQNALAALTRAEAQLRRSNEELQQFAFVASHDLQEPLRTISVFSQLLARKYAAEDPEMKRLVETVTAGAKRMHTLVSDLLAYSRLGHPDDLEPIDTAQLVASCLDSLSAAIQATGTVVTCKELPVVSATPQLSQVFQNLIDNAIKYRSGDPPRINIWAECCGSEWRFAIQDNGLGIEPEYSSRVFEVFKRLHGRNVPGTGIGLAICKKVVEGCGGRIWVESEPGRGCTFWFSLPS